MRCPRHNGIFISEAYQVQNKTIFLYLFKISREMSSGGLSPVFHVQEDTSKCCLVLIVIHHSHLWKAMGLWAWGRKKVLLTIFFPTTVSLWPILYEYLSRYVKEGNEDHVFMIIRDCLYNSPFVFFASDWILI